ncbi:MAG: alpha-hydroxy-acid oxidizing protein [Actinobacteria bacterium]|nr:alpha-hydroxy-acid oxidizing protein [Actinomycetota bacterium]
MSRTLHSVAHARRVARRRLPKVVFDFVDGGAEDEITLRRNTADLAALTLRPDGLADVSQRDLSTTVLGESVSMPILLAPVGLARLVGGGGERAAAAAAAAAGTVYVLSTQSSYTIEDVAASSSGPRWFQLYPWRDPAVVAQLVDRAERAGYRALCLTIDVPTVGKRERDLHNRMVLPPRPRPHHVLEAAIRWPWIRDVILGEPVRFANLAGIADGDSTVTVGQYVSRELANPGATWAVVGELRERWEGPLLVKGVLTAADARHAVDHGVDGIVVSNHGGRQLDGVSSSIRALTEVVAEVGDDAQVLMDGGVRRGSDVVKALALGARAVLVGRPYLWGLAVGGQAGVEAVLAILADELDRCLTLLGRATPSSVDRHAVAVPTAWVAPRVLTE